MILLGNLSPTDDYQYYSIITDNNLFRPLGWTKPDPRPKYELFGTIIREGFSKAYVNDIFKNRILVVGVGDTLPSMGKVLELDRNKILLENIELKSSSIGFLNVSKSNKRNSRKSNSTSTSTKTSVNKNDSITEKKVGGTGRGQQWQTQIQRFQSASPEEREKMIQEFRQMRGNRGQNRRRRNRNR